MNEITEALIRKAGQVAVDQVAEYIHDYTPNRSVDDLVDYLTRIVDSCVSAALAAAEEQEPVAWTHPIQLQNLKREPHASAVMWGEGNKRINIPLYAEPIEATIKIRALEWNQHRTSTWYAESIIGAYGVWEGHYQPPGGYGGITAGSTVEEAKAAAQADYERRIVSAFATRPSPSGEAVEARRLALELEKVAEWINGLPIPTDGATRVLTSIRRALTQKDKADG